MADPTEDDFFGDQASSDDAASREQQWKSLREEHLVAGFREGSEVGHEAEMQSGFDAGFLEGAKATADAGFWLGASAVVEAFYSQARTKRKAALGDSEDSQKDVTALKQDKALLEAQVEKLREDDDAAVDAAGLRNACNGVVVIANAEESKT